MTPSRKPSPTPPVTLEDQLEKMRTDWDRRAAENAHHYVATGRDQWSDEEFLQSGVETVRNYIRNDMINVCQGRDPRQMRVLEIGCGAGRITHALAEMFGEVHAVDVSGEMIACARRHLADRPNAFVYQNNGKDLDVLPGGALFDFAFSMIVFQHIPSREIVESYISAVARRLPPGSLFKFQLQGYTGVDDNPGDTWVGAGFSEQMARKAAEDSGFEMRYAHGAGSQDFWLWFFRL